MNDITYERLGEILADNPWGVLHYRDEIITLLKHLDREEQVSARGFYLSAWCGSGDDYKDQKAEWVNVDEHPAREPRAAAWAAFQRLAALTPEDAGEVNDEYAPAPYLRFSAEAQAVFDEWHADLERRLRSGEWPPALQNHFGKFRKLVPSLALTIHLAEGDAGPISETAMQRALAMAAYLESHALRAYAADAFMHANAAAAILSHIKKGDLANSFTARTIYQQCWSGLSRQWVQGALDLLENFNWIRGEKQDTGGRPSKVYTVNPKAVP